MLRLYELAPSPNNTKVRMALRYKGIDFEAVAVDPADRTTVLDATGQELTPAIADKGIVLNDSEAILQYLDANYRETPRLFPATKAGRRECDAWKETLDERVARHWGPPFLYAIGRKGTLDEDAVKRFGESLAWLDGELGDRKSFRGDPDMAVCDLRVAEWATYALPGEGLLRRVPAFARFRDVFGVDAGSLPRLEAFLGPWNERLA